MVEVLTFILLLWPTKGIALDLFSCIPGSQNSRNTVTLGYQIFPCHLLSLQREIPSSRSPVWLSRPPVSRQRYKLHCVTPWMTVSVRKGVIRKENPKTIFFHMVPMATAFNQLMQGDQWWEAYARLTRETVATLLVPAESKGKEKASY